MNPNDDLQDGVWVPGWIRLPVAACAIASIVWLAGRMPPLPVAPWAPIQPVRDQEIQTLAAFAAWIGLVVIGVGIAAMMLKPRRRREPPVELPDLVAIRPLNQTAPTARMPPSTALLEIFASPRRMATALLDSPLQVDVQQTDLIDPTSGPEPITAAGVGLPMLHLFGPLAIDRPPRTRVQRSWARGLVAYLAVKGAPATFDELSDALWPNEADARERVWKAKQQAETVVGDALQRERDAYWLDLTQIRRDIDEIERLRGGEPSIEQLDRALALMVGEPLADVSYPWVDNERRRLRAVRSETLVQVAEARLDGNEPAKALNAAEELLRADSLNEQAWQLAMRADAALGHRQAILDRYQLLTGELDERLGLKPSAATRELYLLLLSQT